jgi:hypothetical protein
MEGTLNGHLFTSIAICSIGIILIDTLGSFLSRKYRFNYVKLAPLSGLVWIGAGISVTTALGSWKGGLASGIVGFIDATIGNYIAFKINPYVGGEKFYREVMANRGWISAVQVILRVSLLAFILGLVASSIVSRLI